MLLIKQAYLVKKQKNASLDLQSLSALHTVKKEICEWYSNSSKKIQTQTRRNEFHESEPTRIYHHELHRQSIKRSSILKLETPDGVIEGHVKCAEYLESTVRNLLGFPAELDNKSQEELLSEVSKVITEEDNAMFEKPPTKWEVFSALSASNLSAAAG